MAGPVDDDPRTGVTTSVLGRTRLRRRKRLPSHILSVLQQEKITYQSNTSPGSGTLIASYNVHKCVGTDKRFDPDRTAEVIGEIGADVVALQEADQRFGARSGLLDLTRLERASGLVPVPIRGNEQGHGWHGNVLLFRQGVVQAVHQIRLPGVEPRGALVVDMSLDGGPLRIIAAHLGLLRRSRAQQAEAILAATDMRGERPTLLLGDLNEWRLGFRSSLLRLDPSFGPLTPALPSFPSRFPIFALDRILANPHEVISSIEVHDTPLARVASDHLPIKARIDLKAKGVTHVPLARRAAFGTQIAA